MHLDIFVCQHSAEIIGLVVFGVVTKPMEIPSSDTKDENQTHLMKQLLLLGCPG